MPSEMRSTMTDVVAKVRRLIQDPASTPSGNEPHFTNAEIQSVLDKNRIDVRRGRLIPSPTYTSSQANYYDHYSQYGDWETDATFQDDAYNDVTGDITTSEWEVGHWTFDTSYTVVLITGKTFDVYAAAAQLLTEWTASAKSKFSFATDKLRFSRDQEQSNLLQLRDTYLALARPRSVEMVRDDVNAGSY